MRIWTEPFAFGALWICRWRAAYGDWRCEHAHVMRRDAWECAEQHVAQEAQEAA